MSAPSEILTLGWREWVSLPDIGIRQVKAKVDTGARTSALHAFEVRPYSDQGRDRVEFRMHPIQKDDNTIVTCNADIIDTRTVTDSGGHTELRPVILTSVLLGDLSKKIEITLTNRESMKFRMLLGRTAMLDDCIVDPAKSYQLGEIKRAEPNRREKL